MPLCTNFGRIFVLAYSFLLAYTCLLPRVQELCWSVQQPTHNCTELNHLWLGSANLSALVAKIAHSEQVTRWGKSAYLGDRNKLRRRRSWLGGVSVIPLSTPTVGSSAICFWQLARLAGHSSTRHSEAAYSYARPLIWKHDLMFVSILQITKTKRGGKNPPKKTRCSARAPP